MKFFTPLLLLVVSLAAASAGYIGGWAPKKVIYTSGWSPSSSGWSKPGWSSGWSGRSGWSGWAPSSGWKSSSGWNSGWSSGWAPSYKKVWVPSSGWGGWW